MDRVAETSVLCDRGFSARMKGNMFKMKVRPAMMFDLEKVGLNERQEEKLEVAERKMLRFLSRMEKTRDENIK